MLKLFYHKLIGQTLNPKCRIAVIKTKNNLMQEIITMYLVFVGYQEEGVPHQYNSIIL